MYQSIYQSLSIYIYIYIYLWMTIYIYSRIKNRSLSFENGGNRDFILTQRLPVYHYASPDLIFIILFKCYRLL